jgi:hypothetical protein
MKTIDEAKAALPGPALAWKECVALAVLARIHGEEEHRFALEVKPDFARFHLDDGGGQSLDAVFARTGVLVRGFDHESPMSPYGTEDGRTWPGVYEGLPAALVPFVVDGRLLGERGDRFPGLAGGVETTLTPVTFAAWWQQGRWECGRINFPTFGPYVSDGSEYLLDLVFNPETWMREYGWERATVEKALRHEVIQGVGLPSEWGYGVPYRYFA